MFFRSCMPLPHWYQNHWRKAAIQYFYRFLHWRIPSLNVKTVWWLPVQAYFSQICRPDFSVRIQRICFFITFSSYKIEVSILATIVLALPEVSRKNICFEILITSKSISRQSNPHRNNPGRASKKSGFSCDILVVLKGCTVHRYHQEALLRQY